MAGFEPQIQTDNKGYAMNIWNPDWFPLPGQAVFDGEKQQIAAVSRAPGNLDLFVIGFDNQTTADRPRWQSSWDWRI